MWPWTFARLTNAAEDPNRTAQDHDAALLHGVDILLPKEAEGARCVGAANWYFNLAWFVGIKSAGSGRTKLEVFTAHP